MLKLKIVLAASLVILGGIFIATIYFVPSEESRSEDRRVQIIKGDSEWVLQCTIINDKAESIEYKIQVTVDGVARRDSTIIEPEKTYVYILHIPMEEAKEREVVFALYKEGQADPVELTTFHLNDS